MPVAAAPMRVAASPMPLAAAVAAPPMPVAAPPTAHAMPVAAPPTGVARSLADQLVANHGLPDEFARDCLPQVVVNLFGLEHVLQEFGAFVTREIFMDDAADKWGPVAIADSFAKVDPERGRMASPPKETQCVGLQVRAGGRWRTLRAADIRLGVAPNPKGDHWRSYTWINSGSAGWSQPRISDPIGQNFSDSPYHIQFGGHAWCQSFSVILGIVDRAIPCHSLYCNAPSQNEPVAPGGVTRHQERMAMLSNGQVWNPDGTRPSGTAKRVWNTVRGRRGVYPLPKNPEPGATESGCFGFAVGPLPTTSSPGGLARIRGGYASGRDYLARRQAAASGDARVSADLAAGAAVKRTTYLYPFAQPRHPDAGRYVAGEAFSGRLSPQYTYNTMVVARLWLSFLTLARDDSGADGWGMYFRKRLAFDCGLRDALIWSAMNPESQKRKLRKTPGGKRRGMRLGFDPQRPPFGRPLPVVSMPGASGATKGKRKRGSAPSGAELEKIFEQPSLELAGLYLDKIIDLLQYLVDNEGRGGADLGLHHCDILAISGRAPCTGCSRGDMVVPGACAGAGPGSSS